jgi:transposase
MIVDAHGRPRVLALSGGHTNDIKPAAALLKAAAPTVRAIADKAYDSADLRKLLAERNVKAIIPNRRNRKQPYPFDGHTYKRRNIVERTFCRLKDFRRLATRYDRLAATFLATVCLSATVAYWLK